MTPLFCPCCGEPDAGIDLSLRADPDDCCFFHERCGEPFTAQEVRDAIARGGVFADSAGRWRRVLKWVSETPKE